MTTPRLVKDIASGVSLMEPEDLTAVGNLLYFTARDGVSGRELWRSDGTSAGTLRVKDINPGSGDAFRDEAQTQFVPIGSALFFVADNDVNGRELWKTDGTAAGTVLVKDIRLGAHDSSPTELVAIGSTLYFRADDGVTGMELWKSDGNAASTVRIKDINGGSTGSFPYDLTALGRTLYFVAFDTTNGNELWKSDGTPGGTVLLKNIHPGSMDSDPKYLTVMGNTLYFVADDMFGGKELWKSDGTANGTVRVKDIHPGYMGSDPEELTVVGNTLYFTAVDMDGGRELWKSNGTEAGTVRVKDIIPGLESSLPTYLTAVGNRLYFSARNRLNGQELWKTDGTEASTVMVKDIRSGTGGSNPYLGAALGNTLYFQANDGSSGDELWKTDGTAAGTVRVADLKVGSSSSNPSNFTVVGTTLFFTADAGSKGVELWAVDAVPPAPVITLALSPASVKEDGIANLVYTFTRTGSTAAPLTVNYTVGGNASLGVDYTGIAPTPATKTVTFAAGSATASVTVNPTPDTTAEADETVALTLGAGNGYTVGTTTAVVGTIVNVNPDYSDAPLQPTPIPGNGNTFFVGNTVGGGDVADYVNFVVPQGTILTSIQLTSYSSADPRAFIALQEGATFTATPVNGTLPNAIGFTHFGSGVSDASIGSNLIGKLGGSQRAGTYSLWIQQLGAQTEYTFTLGLESSLPTITLSLSPASVGEDGPSNLVYTFSRTGSTAAPLTVNYTVGGTATRGVDYTGIAATPATKSITIAAGSASASITVDPTPDRIPEANETIALTLAASTDYTIGTASAVTGTLLNDDRLGTSRSNTIVGTALSEYIDGLEDKDTLTGGTGPDVFGFRYGHSPLTAPDRITDFQFGTDKIDLFSSSSGAALPAPTGFTRASNNSTATTLAALATAVFSDANGALAGNQALGANRAALVVATKAPIAGTYLFINDGSAARSNSNDLLIHLSGVSGALPGLGVIPVGSVFV